MTHNQTSNTSIVIEYEISGEQELLFMQWQSQLRAAVIHFKGYLNTDIFPPIKEVQDKWYIVVHFDTPANLTQWLDSDSRHNLIKFGQKNFGSYQYQKLGTGLEGWFNQLKKTSSVISRPPAWKQNFAVLFGLYPTVMFEALLFPQLGLMNDWSLAYRVFVNNLISCSLLTWVVMPFVTKLLNFWLRPQRSPVKLNLIGTSLVFVGYGFMIFIFRFLS